MNLNCLSNGEGWDWLSSPNVLLKFSKMTVTCPKSIKRNQMVNFDLLQVRNITINLEMLTVSKMTSLKIYISPVMEMVETSNFDNR